MKDQGTVLRYFGVRCRSICWHMLIIGLIFISSEAMARFTPVFLDSKGQSFFSPDGTLLAGGPFVYNVPSGLLLTELNGSAVGFSPDSTLLIARVGIGVGIWEMPSGTLLYTLKHDNLKDVILSSDGEILVTTNNDYSAIKVWEMSSGNLLTTLRHDSGEEYDSSEEYVFPAYIALSPNGRLLATANGDVKVWAMPSGNLLSTFGTGIHSIVFSPNGNLLATSTFGTTAKLRGWPLGAGDPTAKLWEVPSGKLLTTLRHEESAVVHGFNSDGTVLVTKYGAYKYINGKSYFFNYACFWDVFSGKLLTKKEFRGELVVFSPDGKFVVIGSELLEIHSRRLITTLRSSGYIAFSPDGKCLVAEEHSRTTGGAYIELMEMPSGRYIASTAAWMNESHFMNFSPDSKILVASGMMWVPNTTDVPSLIQPSDGAVFSTAMPKFVWEELPNVLLYDIQIAKDRSFSQIELERFMKWESLHINKGQLDLGMYFWRVRTGGWTDFGEWSEVQTFELTGPPAPIPIVPSDGAVFVDTLTPIIQWKASENADFYTAQIASDVQFSIVEAEESNIEGTKWYVNAGELAPGQYFWRVNATSTMGTGNWSNPRSFALDFPANIVTAPTSIITRTDFDFEMNGLRNVTVPIIIDKTQDLYGFQFDLRFNPRILEATKVTEGALLKSIGGNTSFLKPTIKNSIGVIENVVSSRMSPGEVNDPGVLAEIEFIIREAGTSSLTFTVVKLSDEQFQPLEYAYVNGSLTLNVEKTEPSARIWLDLGIANNQLLVKILIEDAVNLRGYLVNLAYPPELELVEISQGDFLNEGWQHYTSTFSGVEAVSFEAGKALGESISGSGAIATLTFRIWEGGEQLFECPDSALIAPVTEGPYASAVESSSIIVIGSPNWDVNKDYVVDMQDIVILGTDFDKQIIGNSRPDPDVTRDGVLDIFDLVAVASHYAEEYSAVPQPLAAPIARRRPVYDLPIPNPDQLSILQNLHDTVIQYPNDDPSIVLVKKLLTSLIEGTDYLLPDKTQLAQNYPNPFNPETWIPFNLEKSGDVTIRIFNVTGQLVRMLSLGQKTAGFYLTQDKAAYWDGRNNQGERAASGTYFYTLTSGEFTATKKLTILK